MGEPLRLMVDLPNDCEILDILIHKPGRRLLVASDAGDGFIVPEDEIIAQTRSGKQVLNVRGDVKAKTCLPIAGDHVAVVGENRKVLVFSIEELPEMNRGKGVRLQKYKDGGLADVKSFALAQGLEFKYGAGMTTVDDVTPWIGKRASAGRLPPNGFPKNNQFD